MRASLCAMGSHEPLPLDSDERSFLTEAIALACEAVRAGGGPFGALVVRAGRVLGRGCNAVVPTLDPSAHAEIVAIRAACQETSSHALPGATIFSSCEPCPMCLAAIHWARIERVVFAASRHDAAAAGFDDAALYAAFAAGSSPVTLARGLEGEADEPFRVWAATASRRPY